MNTIKYPFTNSVVFAMVMEDPDLCRELNFSAMTGN